MASLLWQAVADHTDNLQEDYMALGEDPDDIIDSPNSSVAEHIRRYVATNGKDGHKEAGVTNLLLTTRGRKSDRQRRTAVFYGEDDGRYVLAASHMSGGPRQPSWYLNLVAHPEVRVQVGAEKFTARARTAAQDEKPRLWRLMTSLWPDYDTPTRPRPAGTSRWSSSNASDVSRLYMLG